MAGMGLPRAGGYLVLAVPSWFPGHVDYVCLFLKPGCHKVQRPLGLGLWSEGWLSLPCLAALLGLGLWDTTSSDLAVRPALWPFLSSFLLTPPYTSCSPWPGQEAGQALGVSSFLPAQGQGVAVGQEGEGTPFCYACSSLLPTAVPQFMALPGCLSLGCPLFLPFQQGLRIWVAHSATLHSRAWPRGWVEEVLRRWQLRGELALCSLFALLGPGAGSCSPRHGS